MIEASRLKNVSTFIQRILSFALSRKIINIYKDIARPGVYPKFLIFNLPNVSNKDALLIRKRPLHSAISMRDKEDQHLSKELSLSENVLSTQLFTIYFYILTKSITSYNKKSLQKLLYIQQKKVIFTDKRLQLTYIHS